MSDNSSPAPRGDSQRVAWWALACAVAALLLGIVALLVALDRNENAAPADVGDAATATAPLTPATTASPPTAPASEVPAVEPTEQTTTPSATDQPTIPTEATFPSETFPGETSSTTVPPTTTSDTVSAAIWPRTGSGLEYADPAAAAEAFALDFVGFDQVIVGEFLAGDSRSGDVEIRPRPAAIPMVVHVRQLDDESWSVIGASHADITVTQPAALEEIASPMTLVGEARAFEGTVQVRLYSDGSDEPVVTGFVTGSGGPEPGPFTEVFEWNTVTAPGATLLLFWTSPIDGSVEEAAAVRLRFHDVPV